MHHTYVYDLQMIKPEKVKEHKEREYNPAEWRKIIDRYNGYGDPIFYIARAEDNPHWKSDKFFVEYTVDGIRHFKEVHYYGILDGHGFCSVEIMPGEIEVTYYGDRDYGRIADTEKNREIMARMSKFKGTVFTKHIF